MKKYIFILLFSSLCLIFGCTKEEKNSKTDNNMNCFYYEDISASIREEMINVSYKENNCIAFNDLSLVHVLYNGFDDKTHKGELIVNKKIASDIVEIFKVLYENNYKIERVERIDKYNGDEYFSF